MSDLFVALAYAAVGLSVIGIALAVFAVVGTLLSSDASQPYTGTAPPNPNPPQKESP